MARRLILLLAAFTTTACNEPPKQQPAPRPYGIQIFAEDTVSARISVEASGDMQLDLKGDDFRVMPDRSFTVSTPATLTIVRGAGTATITSVDSTSRLAVIPADTPQDSIDAATITGTVISLTRSSGDGALQTKVVRP